MSPLVLVDRLTEPMLLRRVLRDAGITYRQLDYWTTCGIIRSSTRSPGSGHPRSWSEQEIEIAGVIGWLRRAEIPLNIAARVARAHVVDGAPLVEIAPGISLLIEPVPS